MKSRALLAVAVLSTALVSGGWFVERGLAGAGGNPTDASASVNARMFGEVLAHVQRDYVDTLADTAIFRRAAEGLIGELHDPHSTYLSPRLLQSLSERTSGKYAGVGANIDVRDGWPTIVAPLPGGPALAAGIHAGDRITEVDGKPMQGVTTEEAQKALRGPPNSVVKLTIERPGIAAAMKYALTRKEIHVRSVQRASILGDGIGYVALTIFSSESADELKQAIDSLRTAGMKTLIFDLRGDPGGLLDEGVSVADLFLDPKQRIVSIRGRAAATSAYDDKAPQAWPAMPIVVLVDSSTASAAEIVAGALQDHDRAVLLGTTTYGKGSAQNVFPLTDGGAAKLTTALWFTPSGRSINRKRPSPDAQASGDTTTPPRPKFKTDSGRTVLGGGGITPDVVLPPPTRSSNDTVFERALGDQIPKFRDALTAYALSLKASGGVTSPDFTVTPAMRAELLRRMRERGITIDDKTYAAGTGVVDRLIGYEVARYVFGDVAEAKRRIHDDSVITRALEFARGASTQKDLLERAAK